MYHVFRLNMKSFIDMINDISNLVFFSARKLSLSVERRLEIAIVFNTKLHC